MRVVSCSTRPEPNLQGPAIGGGPRCSEEMADFLHDLYGANEPATDAEHAEAARVAAFFKPQVWFAHTVRQRPRYAGKSAKRRAAAEAFAAMYDD
jgi:hypothetical protein